MNVKFLTLVVSAALVLAGCGVGAPSETAPLDKAGLIDLLTEAGATVESAGSVEQSFLSVGSETLKVNGVEVQVFEYATVEALETDAVTISPDGSSTDTIMITWIATPHFFKSGRVIALYVGDDAEIVTLLSAALGPQFAGR
ncbi:MAG: hypothetical protein EPO32_11105 [Anaerolineae bacterium]|nr:MAG: hypothetical protein EPO32_11105 [Anaerolineae bacterium]